MAGNAASSQPLPMGRPASSKWPPVAACAKSISGTPCEIGWASCSISWTNVSMLVPVAASDFASDSVEGQRERPCGVVRLDRLKVVGSSPAFLARPDGESPARAARRSIAVQTCECVNIPAVLRMPVPGCCLDYGPYIGTGTAFPGFSPTTDHPRGVSGLWTKPRIDAVLMTRRLAAVYW